MVKRVSDPKLGGVFIALGSNLGDRAAHISGALRDLGATAGIRVLRCSSVHETEPVGGPPGQGKFLNAVAELATTLAPEALLNRLQVIELGHGRARGVRNGPRTLDLDLLLYGDVRRFDARLTLPHPRMWEREFVLAPLAELCDVGRLRARFGGDSRAALSR
ncbi:MAG: 2-amino-4-hydroxy-6-hydroxymethyldihydropteridine diphosphokinase [Phycisphaerae bacterium]|jgi:2-amino-4-hydroxy-6-hydroxymethyldihydropteridine diphosphokinase